MILKYQTSPEIIHLKNVARSSGIPLFGGFELTSRCNFNCKMCYIHDSSIIHNELTTTEWKKLFDDAISAGMMFALLTGGECLLRDDFKELYLYLYNKGIIMSVNTNGSLIDEEIADFFAKYIPERIQISIYGSNEDAYYNVTERHQYQRVMHAIDLLVERNLVPDIAITPSKYMKDDFEHVLRLVNDKNLPYTVTMNLFPPRNGEKNDDCYLSVDEKLELQRIHRIVKGRSIHNPNNNAPSPGADDLNMCQYGMPCNAGTIRFVITSTGLMIPCMSIPEVSIDTKSNSFIDCWNYIKSNMKCVIQPNACSNCVYKKHCFRCPVTRYEGLFSGKVNTEICNFMVSEYKMGLIT